VALWRALFEAAQVRLTAIAGARDDLDPRVCTASPSSPGPGAGMAVGRSIDFATVPDVERDDFGEDVEALIGDLRAAGFAQVLRVDLTRAEIGIAVVRLIVPGLLPDPHLLGPSRPPHAASPSASAKA
jgi:ribosomal protein S12 methylthiotransferase accessory factor